jgi:hypothetical protein
MAEPSQKGESVALRAARGISSSRMTSVTSVVIRSSQSGKVRIGSAGDTAPYSESRGVSYGTQKDVPVRKK